MNVVSIAVDVREPVFTDVTVFSSPLVEIGAFRCDRRHPRFHDTGPTEHDLFVFPRTSVVIEHEHERPFVTNPNVVVLYNRGQAYRREPISARGDSSDWFGVSRQVALDVVRSVDASVEASPDRPFRAARAGSDTSLYARQRRLFERLTSGDAPPPAFVVEEETIGLLERVVRRAYGTPHERAGQTARKQVDAVFEVERIVSGRFDRPLSLADLGSAVGLSPFHMCRTFRRVTGRTLGDYRQQLRLRTALELLRETREPITSIALDLGFSSHSHFTYAFRRLFGRSPSAVRGESRSRQ